MKTPNNYNWAIIKNTVGEFLVDKGYSSKADALSALQNYLDLPATSRPKRNKVNGCVVYDLEGNHIIKEVDLGVFILKADNAQKELVPKYFLGDSDPELAALQKVFEYATSPLQINEAVTLPSKTLHVMKAQPSQVVKAFRKFLGTEVAVEPLEDGKYRIIVA